MDNQIKRIIKVKEIVDIISDYNRMVYLWNINDEYSLMIHINSIHNKYPAEICIYNAVNPVEPRTLEENVAEGGRFLDGVLNAKMLDLIKEIYEVAYKQMHLYK